MKIGIASDHRGYKVKEMLKEKLSGYTVVDFGTDSEEPTDFPVYAKKLGVAILSKKVDFGIAICGTGIGILLEKAAGDRRRRACLDAAAGYGARVVGDDAVVEAAVAAEPDRAAVDRRRGTCKGQVRDDGVVGAEDADAVLRPGLEDRVLRSLAHAEDLAPRCAVLPELEV